MRQSTNRCSQAPPAVIRVTRITHWLPASSGKRDPKYDPPGHMTLDRDELDGLSDAHRDRSELDDARAEIERLTQAIAAAEETMVFLRERYLTLRKIEQGGWWRLRGRILPLIRAAGVVQRRLRGLRDGGQGPTP